MRTDFPMGATVRYMDSSATVEPGDVALVEGIVNGPPIENGTGRLLVPVFSRRSNGREPTTVYVHESNIMEVRGE